MNPPFCSEEGDSQRTAPCRSQGTTGDRWDQHGRSVPPGSAWLLGCWGPRAAARGTCQHPLPVPPREAGWPQTVLALSSHSPSPSAAPGARGTQSQPRATASPAKAGTQTRLCVCKGKVSFGEKMRESSTTGACAFAAFHLEVVTHEQRAAEVSNTPLLLPAPFLRPGSRPTTGTPLCKGLEHTGGP